MLKIKGGRNFYGFVLGVIMLETHFPRVPGDIGNAQTWEFPVLYKVVKDANPKKIIEDNPMPLVEKFVLTAKELEEAGVSLIATSCGFLSLFQEKIATELRIPFISSALMLVPLVYKMIGLNKKVGIVTANSQALTTKHLQSVGADNIPVRVVGIEDTNLGRALLYDQCEIDFDLAREEMLRKAITLTEDRSVGAIVLECTNMPPFSEDIKQATGLPVFDVVGLVNLVYRAVHSSLRRY
ncbi:aspartate/glutamate racemase family protein [Pseudothermotoga sp. U03pept]|uniref:aspartate/glutamate racemase family protein n=1 Tax=Pseudothermotoga sp. U03pept TaxID=3447012 RepID=UPI003EFC132F